MSGQLGFVAGSKTKDFHNRVAKRRNREGPFGQPGQGGPKPQQQQAQAQVTMMAPPAKPAGNFVQKSWNNATMVITQPQPQPHQVSTKVAAYPKMLAAKPQSFPTKPSVSSLLNNTGKVPLPADIQEKMERWKARRAEKDKNEARELQQYEQHYGIPEPVVQIDTFSESEEENDEPPPQPEIRQLRNQAPPPALSLPLPLSQQPQLPLSETAAPSSLYHPSNQEILRGMVATEVAAVLDKLKTTRPELADQAGIMDIVNKSTRTVEDALQQSTLREQRLQNSVENLEIKLRSIQNNIDQIRQESGMTFVDEATMKSFTAHFFNEEIGKLQLALNKDIKTNMQAFVQDKNNTVDRIDKLEKSVTELKIILENINTLFQNSVQKIYEQTCYTRGKVLRQINVHSAQDTKSDILYTVPENEHVILYYPIENKENGDIWMKTRRVNPLNGVLSEGWAPVMTENQPNIGQFSV